MDWAKIGQAFSAGANVYAGGLMDRYQRGRDIQDWKSKALWEEENIINPRREATQDADEKKRQEQSFRDSFKDDVQQFPELQPFVEGYLTGDEQAKSMLSIYAGAKHKMAKNTPLTSEEITELGPLPPGVRHGIIQGHLSALQKRLDEESDRKRKENQDKLTMARLNEVDARTKKLLEEQGDQGAIEAARIGLRDLTEEQKAREKAETQLQSVGNTILTISGQIGEKKRQRDKAKGKDQAGFNTELAALAGKLKAAEETKKNLERYLGQDAARRLPGVAPEYEEPEEPTDVLDEETTTAIQGLPEGDRADLYALMKARPDLTQEQCVQVFMLFKEQEAAKARTVNQNQMAGMRIK